MRGSPSKAPRNRLCQAAGAAPQWGVTRRRRGAGGVRFSAPGRPKLKTRPLGGQRLAQRRSVGAVQAVAIQYPALNGLLIRSACGLTSKILSVGIGSSLSSATSSPLLARATENE